MFRTIVLHVREFCADKTGNTRMRMVVLCTRVIQQTCSEMAQRELKASPRKPNCEKEKRFVSVSFSGMSREKHRRLLGMYRVQLREIVESTKF